MNHLKRAVWHGQPNDFQPRRGGGTEKPWVMGLDSDRKQAHRKILRNQADHTDRPDDGGRRVLQPPQSRAPAPRLMPMVNAQG